VTDVHPAAAAGFAAAADVYERARPSYPQDAVDWIVERAGLRPGRVVVDLAAGTGKLTRLLVPSGAEVVAVEPVPEMRAKLEEVVPGVSALYGTAERLPFADGSADVVTVAQAFHWFDHERALPEIARVLRPGGTLALVWNLRDESVPWVRRLGKLIGSERPGDDPNKDAVEILERSGLFEGIETRTFRHWQEVGRDSLIGLVESRSYVAAMAERERAALLRQVGELYDEYGRGHDGMQLPYLTECYRAHVVSTFGTGGTHGGLDDGLLIDFS
jgi:SAM-dependent methyltransferase